MQTKRNPRVSAVLTWGALPALGLLGPAVGLGSNPFIQFRPFLNYTVAGSEPKGIVPADFDLDGHLDLVTACNGNSEDPVGEMGVNLGDGLGHFNDDKPFGTQPQLPWAVAAGDFNEDGFPDLAYTDGRHDSSSVQISLGNGQGEFVPLTTLAASAFPVGVVAGDFNLDAHLDLAVVGNVGTRLTVFHGDGAGGFAAAQDLGVAMCTGLAGGDFDHDGFVDLVAAHYNGASAFRNLGNGTFAYVGSAGSNALTQAVDLGDINGDGNLDVASTLLYFNQLVVRLGTGTGSFGAPQTLATGNYPYDVAVADLNRDGYADVAIANLNVPFFVRVYLGTPAGLAGTPHDFPAGPQPAVLAAGDFDEDGWPDIGVALRNFGDTTLLSVLLQRPLGDLNCDGAVNFDDINPFVLALSNPAAYQAAYPGCELLNGDFDGNGQVNFDDINAFVAVLAA